MKKSKLIVAAALSAALCLTGTLAACGGESHSLEKVDAKAATCTAPAYSAYYKCTDDNCGKIFSDEEGKNEVTLESLASGEALGHTGGTATCTVQASCTRCGTPYGDLLAHDFTGYSQVEGGHTVGCKVCQAPDPDGAFVAHKYDQMVLDDTYLKSEANCTNYATYYKLCVCGAQDEAETFEITPELGGQLGNHKVEWVKTEDGHYKICSICEKADTKTSEGTHSYGDYVTSDTDHHKECADCGYITLQATHTYTEVENEAYLATAATCTRKATYYKSCVCGVKSTETFEGSAEVSGQHTDGWTIADGTHKNVCPECGTVVVEEGAHDYVLTAQLVEGKTYKAGQSVAAADVTVNLACSVCHKDITEATPTVEVTAHTLNAGANTVSVHYSGYSASVEVTAAELENYTLTLVGATSGGGNTVSVQEGAPLPEITSTVGKTLLGYKDQHCNLYITEALPAGYTDNNLTSCLLSEAVMPEEALTLEAIYLEDAIYFAPADYQSITPAAKVGDHVRLDNGQIVTRFTWDSTKTPVQVRSKQDTGSMPVNVIAPAYGKSLMYICVINNGNSDVTLDYRTENWGFRGQMSLVAKANSTTTVPFIYSLDGSYGTYDACDHYMCVTSDIGEGESVTLDFYGYVLPLGKLAPTALEIAKTKTEYENGEKINVDDITAKLILGENDKFYVNVYNFTTDVAADETYTKDREQIEVYAYGQTGTVNLTESGSLVTWIATSFSKNLGGNKDGLTAEYVNVEGTNLTATKYTFTTGANANADFSTWPSADGNNPNTNGYSVRIPSYSGKERQLRIFVTNNGTSEISFKVYAENNGDRGGCEVTLAAGESGTYDFTVNPGTSTGCNYNFKILKNLEAGASFTIYGYFKTYDDEINALGINSGSTHQKTFKVGDTFTANKLTVDVTGSTNGNSNDVNISNFTTDLDGHVFTAEDIGEKTVTVSWNGLTTTYTITVTA